MIEYEFFRVIVDDGLADVVIDKPPMNSLDYALYDELRALLATLETDDSVRAVLFRSEHEKIFISGADIKDMEHYDRRVEPLTHKVDTVQATFTQLQSFPKPTVVAITGHALGGGCEFALCVDFRVMTEGFARIGQPEVGLGIMPGGGGTQRLARLIGRANATEMLMLGEHLSATAAHGFGLVSRVGPSDDETLRIAREVAGGLASKAPIALAAIKHALNEGVDSDLAHGLSVERKAVIELLQTKDAEEGVAAFLERRPPKWRGQ